MFTGLVADCGEILSIKKQGRACEFIIKTQLDTATFELGESIAINGVCLTVTHFSEATFGVDIGLETLNRTALETYKAGMQVHLERALAASDRLGGHFMLGHVDGVGVLKSFSKKENTWFLEIDAPPQVARYLIDKGSISVDGVSLTVNWVKDKRFGLAIVPFTVQKTNLLQYKVGQSINLEADILGKYVEKFMGLQQGDQQSANGVDMQKLKDYGFK